MGVERRNTDAIIARIAKRQHSVVARDQLLAAGVSRREIEGRLRSGMLRAIHRGVYLVGFGPVPMLAREAAAILACRPRALLGRRIAAALWELPARPAERIEVIVVGRKRAPLSGIQVSSISHLNDGEMRRISGLPVTAPALTLLDVAALGDAEELIGCVHEARVRRLVTDRGLRATLAAHPNRHGARVLADFLDTERGPRLTRSRAERRALHVMRSHGLEPDASEFSVGPYTLDFYFQVERVAVEYDSQTFHDNPRRFVRDRRRIAYLAARGIITFPLTAHDIGAGAGRAMADLRAALASRGDRYAPTR